MRVRTGFVKSFAIISEDNVKVDIICCVLI
jgi:hypothetical protein